MNPREEQKLKSLTAISSDKELVFLNEVQDINDKLSTLIEKESPDRTDELLGAIENLTEVAKKKSESEVSIEIDPEAIRGPRGPIGFPGPKGEPGYTPKKGIDYFDGLPGKSVTSEEVVKEVLNKIPPVKIPEPDSAGLIKLKLESLRGEDRLDARAIKGLPNPGTVIYNTRGGGSGGGGLDTTAGDARYLKLDASNDPLTGSLAWSSAVEGSGSSFASVPNALGTGTTKTYQFLAGGGNDSMFSSGGGTLLYKFNDFTNFGFGTDRGDGLGTIGNRFMIDFGQADVVTATNALVLKNQSAGGAATTYLGIIGTAGVLWNFKSTTGLSFTAATGDLAFSGASNVNFIGGANATINFGYSIALLNLNFNNGSNLGSGQSLMKIDADYFQYQTGSVYYSGSFWLGVGGLSAGTFEDDGWAQIRTEFKATDNKSTAALHIKPSINNKVGSTLGYAASTNIEGFGGTNAGTITDVATLRLGSAPTIGTSKWTLWIDAGVSRFDDNLDFSTADATNLVLGTTTGTKIGTGTTQKLSFWNATPISQPTTGVAAATFVANTSGIANDTATFDGYTIGQVVKALRNEGLLA